MSTSEHQMGSLVATHLILENDNKEVCNAVGKVPREDKLVRLRLCLETNELLSDESKSNGENHHQGFKEDDGKITCAPQKEYSRRCQGLFRIDK